MRPKHVFALAGLLLLACIGFYAASDGNSAGTDPCGGAGRGFSFEARQ